MKKIGIITIVKVNNYGAELQAYATQKVLQLMGYDAEIIDYLFYKNPRYKKTRMSRPLFPMPIKKRLTEYLFPKISYLKQCIHHSTNGNKRIERFSSFHQENTHFSREFRSINELYNAVFDYDVYIVGSDQVWNPGIYSNISPYFLTFAPKEKKRISYASSIGVSSLPESTKSFYKNAFLSLDAISVREDDAVRLIKEISGKDAQLVLDPTLLLSSNEWKAVSKAEEGIDYEYVLLYELTPCPYLKKLAKDIATKKQLKIVRITKDAVRIEPDNEVVNILDAGPAEFLWLFDNANFIITNSFHGTAFSINMNKNFYVITPSRKNNNSRQKSILKLFGLENRLLIEDSPMPSEDIYDIDFVPVNQKLEEQRILSKKYLKDNIDG